MTKPPIRTGGWSGRARSTPPGKRGQRVRGAEAADVVPGLVLGADGQRDPLEGQAVIREVAVRRARPGRPTRWWEPAGLPRPRRGSRATAGSGHAVLALRPRGTGRPTVGHVRGTERGYPPLSASRGSSRDQVPRQSWSGVRSRGPSNGTGTGLPSRLPMRRRRTRCPVPSARTRRRSSEPDRRRNRPGSSRSGSGSRTARPAGCRGPPAGRQGHRLTVALQQQRGEQLGPHHAVVAGGLQVPLGRSARQLSTTRATRPLSKVRSTSAWSSTSMSFAPSIRARTDDDPRPDRPRGRPAWATSRATARGWTPRSNRAPPPHSRWRKSPQSGRVGRARTSRWRSSPRPAVRSPPSG